MSEKLKIQDLRLGNFLKWKDNGSIFELTLDLFCDRNFQNHISNGDIIGIPLTSEILLNIKGFYIEDETISSTFYEHEKHRIIIINSFGKFTVGFAQIEIIEISFLHELQNIFKCICGEELEFKNELK